MPECGGTGLGDEGYACRSCDAAPAAETLPLAVVSGIIASPPDKAVAEMQGYESVAKMKSARRRAEGGAS